MSNIKEVAARAGVSVATVSRVINGGSVVRESTRKKVEAAIRELRYSPNFSGRSLRTSKTGKILVMLPSLKSFYSTLVASIEKTAKAHGYSMLICHTKSDKEAEKSYLELLKNKMADGVIFLSTRLTAAEMNTLAGEYPVVQCCEYVRGSNTGVVSVDDEAASFEAVTALIARGHKRISLFGAERVGTASDREAGYRRALASAGLPVDREEIYYDNHSAESGRRRARRMLEAGRKPEAIFSISDIISLPALREFYEHGLLCPRDFSLVSFDGSEESSVSIPALSTVEQPREAMGREAFLELYNRLNDPDYEARIIRLPHRLVLRETIR